MSHTISVLFATSETLVRLALSTFLLTMPLLWLDNHLKARHVLALERRHNRQAGDTSIS